MEGFIHCPQDEQSVGCSACAIKLEVQMVSVFVNVTRSVEVEELNLFNRPLLTLTPQ